MDPRIKEALEKELAALQAKIEALRQDIQQNHVSETHAADWRSGPADLHVRTIANLLEEQAALSEG